MTTTQSSNALALNGRDLTSYDVRRVAERGVPVAIPAANVEKMARSRGVVERMLAEDRVVYGITTGFGFMKNQRIGTDAVAELQRNLIRSHAAGVGAPFSTEVVRAMMLLRVNALVKGFSGIRPEVVGLLVDMLNAGVHPVIPSQGSVGASGDLAPLSHLALVLMGEGLAEFRGEILSGAAALAAAGLSPVALEAKEGLALVNGTQAMGAMGALGLEQARLLFKAADVALACSLEGLLGSLAAYRPEVHRLRPHPGQMAVARNVSRLAAGSALMESHKDCDQVQDAYSLRCAPQVHGASRDALAHARGVFAVELNAVTDNPLVFPESEEAISAGHFHGQPLALVLDFLGLAVAEIGSISERRVERLVNPALSNGLPAFLASDPGLHSGLMVAQYTAASLVSENKVLVHPASADSIPTSANQEDHVSMGTTAARKLGSILENVAHVVAIELMAAARALDLREGEPGKGVAAAHAAVRRLVAPLTEDRFLTPDIEALTRAVLDGSIVAAVEEAVGPLE